jgi:hypothetical protein
MTKLCFLGDFMTSSSVARIFATMFIWAAVTILGASTLLSSGNLGGAPVVIIMVLLIGAAASLTQFFWKMTDERDMAEKSKRHSRIDQLLVNLNDEDITELRARLMAEADGEQVTLDELMTEHEKRRS